LQGISKILKKNKMAATPDISQRSNWMPPFTRMMAPGTASFKKQKTTRKKRIKNKEL
jgi:hypothetical protein